MKEDRGYPGTSGPWTMYRQANTDEGRPWVRGMPCILLRGIAITATVLLMATGCLGQETEPSLEEQAQGIDRSLMCPVCPSETVDQSQVPLAKQMRAIIREKLAAGDSRQDILDFFSSRYGEAVLAAPLKSGFNLLVWIMPVVGILVGGVTLMLILRAMRGRRGPEIPVLEMPPTDGELEPYLSRVEEEMRGVLGDAPHPPEGQFRG